MEIGWSPGVYFAGVGTVSFTVGDSSDDTELYTDDDDDCLSGIEPLVAWGSSLF